MRAVRSSSETLNPITCAHRGQKTSLFAPHNVYRPATRFKAVTYRHASPSNRPIMRVFRRWFWQRVKDLRGRFYRRPRAFTARWRCRFGCRYTRMYFRFILRAREKHEKTLRTFKRQPPFSDLATYKLHNPILPIRSSR